MKYHGFSMPNKWTFEIPAIKKLMNYYCFGKDVLFPFAGVTRINTCNSAVYIDIDPATQPTIIGDCIEVLPTIKDTFDLVVLDPPFTFFQVVRTYGGVKMTEIRKVKELINPLVRSSGRVITFGFNTSGMGKGRGYYKEAIHLFNHGGNHNDTLMLVEQKNQWLSDYF